VHYCGASALPAFDAAVEAERSRRYWSSAHAECSWDRMKDWSWPPAGSIVADPRTYHPEPGSDDRHLATVKPGLKFAAETGVKRCYR
jgi:hypothetical protein